MRPTFKSTGIRLVINQIKTKSTKKMRTQRSPSHARVTLNQLFTKYDINRNGTLQRDEIKLALSDIFLRLGVMNAVSEADIDNFIQDYDMNHDGRVSLADFMDMNAINFYNTSPGYHLPEEISISIDEIFEMYDHDLNGMLDTEELIECLQAVFDRLGVNAQANSTDVHNFFEDFDANHDGQITRADFKKVYAIKFHSF